MGELYNMGELYFENIETNEVKILNSIQNFGLEVESANNKLYEAFKKMGEISCTFNQKKLKKKRFIKLLMSKGFSKNESIKIAMEVWNKKKTYSDLDLFICQIEYKN